MMPIDSHVHFFTRSLLSEKAGRLLALLRAAYIAEGLVRKEEEGLNPNALMNIIENELKRPDEVLESLDQAYGPGWSYVPLMMDLEYALEDGEELLSQPPSNPEELEETLLPFTDESFRSRGLKRRFWRRFEEAWRMMFGEGLEWGARRLLAQGSFETQRRELMALKASRPDKIFPFLGLDPRRRWIGGVNIVEMAGDLVGPGRPFAGVKLYTSTGYSPTDPALFASGGLYQHCCRYRIPITAHFGASGFATPLSSIRVRGDVYHPLYGEVVQTKLCRFDIKMTPGTLNAAVAERQMKLNHPRLWDKVLDQWPSLVVNFAHAGGMQQAGAWIEKGGYANWVNWAFKQAIRRKNVYVDFSGYAGTDVNMAALAGVLKERHPMLRRKILYGSDYFLSSLKDPDIRSYRERHKAAFGPWWQAMTSANPRRFLAKGAGSRRIGASIN